MAMRSLGLVSATAWPQVVPVAAAVADQEDVSGSAPDPKEEGLQVLGQWMLLAIGSRGHRDRGWKHYHGHEAAVLFAAAGRTGLHVELHGMCDRTVLVAPYHLCGAVLCRRLVKSARSDI
jgi:hypothetical protein